MLEDNFFAMNNQPTEAGFTKQLDTLFKVNVAPKPIDLKLVEVKGFVSGANDPPNMERFSLFFNGPADFYLPQRTYELQHEQMGSLEIFLVTIGQDESGFRYEAVFNYFK